MKASGLSDVGRCREANQDQLLIDADHGLYAVADGMGGHAAGEVASQLAIESLAESVSENLEPSAQDIRQAGQILERAFREGNRKIWESVLTRGEWRGMGTTIVALLTCSDHVVIGHVGDSRAYLLREEALQQLTSDHSWVNEQVKLGLLTSEQANNHPMRNIVTRALGNRTELQVDLTHEPAQPGDLFLLCSDGLNSMLSDEEIRQTMLQHRTDPQVACQALVDAANLKGGEDNITVVVVAIDGKQS